jgi:DNA-binding PadR family transcriptional regulator
MDNIVLTEAFTTLLSLMSRCTATALCIVGGLSSGRVRLAAGTLYGAIATLLEKRWIQALPGETSGRRKEYVITQEGKVAVRSELARLRELVVNGEMIAGGDKL